MASWESASIRCVSQGDGLVSKSGLANPTEGRNRLPDSLQVGGYKQFSVRDHVAEGMQRIRCKHRRCSLISRCETDWFPGV